MRIKKVKEKIFAIVFTAVGILIVNLAWKIGHIPADVKVIRNYSDFNELLVGDILDEYNLEIKFDQIERSRLYLQKGNNYNGWYRYICKDDTCIILFEESSSSKEKEIDEKSGTVEARYDKGSFNKDDWAERSGVDSTKKFIEKEGLFVELRSNSNDDKQWKYGGTTFLLALLGVGCVLFGLMKWE